MVIEDGSHKAHLDLQIELSKRMKMDHIFEEFAKDMPVTVTNGEEFPNPTNFECLRTLMDTFEEHCGKFDDYSLKFVKYLVKECESMPEIYSLLPSIQKIKSVCSQ